MSMHLRLFIILCLFFVLPVNGAVVYDADGKDAIIEAEDDEVFNVGDFLFIANSKGKRKGVVKVVGDRGNLYDCKILYGKVRNGYQATDMTAAQKKKIIAFIKKKKTRNKKKRRGNTKEKESESETAAEPENSSEDFNSEQPESKDQLVSDRKYNISVDIIPFAGDALGVNLLNGAAEYRWNNKLSIGLTLTMGDINFEGTAPPGGFPTISYLGFGAIAHYSFAGDVFANGFYGAGSLQYVKEDWTSTSSFPGLSETGFFVGATVGYQYWIKGFNLRAGLKLNYSTLGQSVVANGFSYARDSTTTGTSFQPTVLIGYGF